MRHCDDQADILASRLAERRAERTNQSIRSKRIRRLHFHHMHTLLSGQVRELALPGSDGAKLSHLGAALARFARLRTLDLSTNNIVSLDVHQP